MGAGSRGGSVWPDRGLKQCQNVRHAWCVDLWQAQCIQLHHIVQVLDKLGCTFFVKIHAAVTILAMNREQGSTALAYRLGLTSGEKTKENVTLFSNYNGSLSRRQPGALDIRCAL